MLLFLLASSITTSTIAITILIKNRNYYTIIHLGYLLFSWNFGLAVLINNPSFVNCSAVTTETLTITLILIMAIVSITTFISLLKLLPRSISSIYLFIYKKMPFIAIDFDRLKYLVFFASILILVSSPLIDFSNLYNLVNGIISGSYEVVYQNRAAFSQKREIGFNKYFHYFYLFLFFNLIPVFTTTQLFICKINLKNKIRQFLILFLYISLMLVASFSTPFRSYIFKVFLYFIFLLFFVFYKSICSRIKAHKNLRFELIKLFFVITIISVLIKTLIQPLQIKSFIVNLFITIVDRIFVIPVFTVQYYINYFIEYKRPFSILNLLLPGKGDEITGDGPYQVTRYFCGGSFHATTDAYTYGFTTQGILGTCTVALLISLLLLSIDSFYKHLAKYNGIEVYLLMFSNIIFTATSFDSTNLPEQVIIYGLGVGPVLGAFLSKKYIKRLKYKYKVN